MFQNPHAHSGCCHPRCTEPRLWSVSSGRNDSSYSGEPWVMLLTPPSQRRAERKRKLGQLVVMAV